MGRLQIIIVTVVVFASVMLGMQAFYWYRQTRKEAESKDLARRLGTVTEEEREVLFRLQMRKREPENTDFFGNIIGGMESKLMEAGNPYPLSTLIMRMVAAGIVGMVFMFVFPTTRGPLAVIGLLFAYIPWWLIKRAAGKRNDLITAQLPDALELVARSLQAGHGIAESLRVCSEEMKMPIAGEFGRVYEQNNLGRDFRECMDHMTTRNPNNFNLKIFASSVLLQRETGGNLIEILESIANTVRQRFIFIGKVRALTAEAKFSAIILAGLPFFVTGAIALIRPNYLLPLIEDPLGNFMLGFVIVWFILGLIVMRELTKVEV